AAPAAHQREHPLPPARRRALRTHRERPPVALPAAVRARRGGARATRGGRRVAPRPRRRARRRYPARGVARRARPAARPRAPGAHGAGRLRLSSGWLIVKRAFASQAFDGEGARLYGGRWSSPGKPVVYLGGTPAIAALEVLAHNARPGLLSASFAI